MGCVNCTRAQDVKDAAHKTPQKMPGTIMADQELMAIRAYVECKPELKLMHDQLGEDAKPEFYKLLWGQIKAASKQTAQEE